jgi:putative ATP-dependent endonuclease of OLD family
MKVRFLEIENFRGVASGQVIFNDNTLLVGGNNVGKSTVCEALDLVLGPERLYRRPAVDEHDFFGGVYLNNDGSPRPIRIRAILIDLSEEALRHFGGHVRRWDDTALTFVDEEPGGADRADEKGVVWGLPVIFISRYDRDEDDFVAETFFDHPTPADDELDDEQQGSLGRGLQAFTRAHKRLCGFVYLRALRTGSRALGLQRGSLLDTILRLGGEGSTEMWLDTLRRLRELDPAVGDVEQLKTVRAGIRERMSKFVRLAPGDQSTAFFASDLTRQHLREVVRLFIATEPSGHPVPFARQGTGSINLLVFALLTLIAELKGNRSVIFAMEEPEIALPPHTQRRVTRFVRDEMGQAIVTSHSPYVIEQFEPDNIVMLHRGQPGELNGEPIDPSGVKPKAYRTERRQFSEAILSRAVLVVEGATEASLLPVASSVLEGCKPEYTHIDLAGVSIFNARSDGSVPRYGPIFKALDKVTFAVFDKQATPLSADAQAKLATYDKYWESPESGIERLLVTQTPHLVLRRFLDDVVTRPDYPSGGASYSSTTSDDDLPNIALAVLKERKGDAWGYAAMLLEHCTSEAELPEFLRTVLLEIDEVLSETPEELPIEATSAAVPTESAAPGGE